MSEVKQYVGAMNRMQQAYFLENNTFASDIEKLGIGIKTETENYSYSTHATDKVVFNYGIPHPGKYSYKTEYIIGLIPRQIKQPLKSWVGGVFIVPATDIDSNADRGEKTTVTILCEANSPGTNKPAQPTYQNGVLACGEGTSEIN